MPPTRIRSLAGFAAAVVLGAAPLAPRLAHAQVAPAPVPAPPAARPTDVQSPDAIIAALYDVISGPAGQARDWDRFRSLFHPGARLIPTGRRQAGGFGARATTPEEYIERSGPMLVRDGFIEAEIARTQERYGNIVHAFSTYESRHAASDPQPFMRGINSIQLFNDGTRWWVMTIYWEGETAANPIPAKYLPK